jgi:site-specific DNA-methyltransferase (adenine-specific)
MECGFNLHDTMIYEKAQACFGSNNCYLQAFEYMFIFSKGKPRVMNFLRDRENVRGGVTEGTVKHGTKPDGSRGERVQKTADKLGKRKNIWKYAVGGGNTGHPAVFPQKLAEDHIATWSNPGDTVLDPFMGSGTTGVAARINGRHFVGFEVFEPYYQIATKRIEAC